MDPFPSPDEVSTLLILVTVFHALAIILTSLRLWFRHHIRRLWWDDFCAALALLCDAVCMVAEWILTAPLDDPYLNFESLPTSSQSRSAHVISYWLNILPYTCSIWFARISIVASVGRVVPPSRCVSITIIVAGGTFVCMWFYVLASKSVACAVDKSWYYSVGVFCPLPKWIAYSEVITDALSDAILVALPIRLLWRVKLPSNQRIMVLSIFSTSILVSVVSVVHTSYLVSELAFISGVTAQIEGAISLVVCNLLVVVTFIYRVTRNGKDLTADVSDKHRTPSSNCLTTVDLDLSGGSGSGFASTTVGTGFTMTNVSSVVFARSGDKDATYGPSVVESEISGLPVLTTNRKGPLYPPPIAMLRK